MHSSTAATQGHIFCSIMIWRKLPNNIFFCPVFLLIFLPNVGKRIFFDDFSAKMAFFFGGGVIDGRFFCI